MFSFAIWSILVSIRIHIASPTGYLQFPGHMGSQPSSGASMRVVCCAVSGNVGCEPLVTKATVAAFCTDRRRTAVLCVCKGSRSVSPNRTFGRKVPKLVSQRMADADLALNCPNCALVVLGRIEKVKNALEAEFFADEAIGLRSIPNLRFSLEAGDFRNEFL